MKPENQKTLWKMGGVAAAALVGYGALSNPDIDSNSSPWLGAVIGGGITAWAVFSKVSFKGFKDVASEIAHRLFSPNQDSMLNATYADAEETIAYNDPPYAEVVKDAAPVQQPKRPPGNYPRQRSVVQRPAV